MDIMPSESYSPYCQSSKIQERLSAKIWGGNNTSAIQGRVFFILYNVKCFENTCVY